MPRPKKNEDEKRTEIFFVRLTPAEYKHLETLSREAGYSSSDYVRMTVLSSEPSRKKPTPEREAILKLNAELNKLGNNVNQIAHVLNTNARNGERSSVPEDVITNAMHGVQTLTRAIHQILRNGNIG